MDDQENGAYTSPTPGEIDKLIHEPARLMIVANLSVVESADFTFLMNRTDLTWGNLSSHLNKLEQAGYVEMEKTFVGKRPYTLLKLTENGRSAFQTYREKMAQVFNNLPE
ncbi:MAG: transcriptional regulator [Chloroflexi bacterium]|nr:MAG: transcriptional regulator [Chloroflexota bacterium]